MNKPRRSHFAILYANSWRHTSVDLLTL